ncbi:protein BRASSINOSTEROID INSENSITIVE 1 precursor [Brassica napus]|uniref:non-specific serine/threonine protein kinase n=1 Tax=Brassica napus TaxID=3708 RepID=K7QLB5_BRANA|nr:protein BRASSINOSTEROID INSENSITIVE 1 precursor [Brassica napus]AFU83229.1 brassinosteroid-insensitive 1 protein [Brassica napus]AFU83231.1 brassinosteroid-insensitive 1 protein [Brassica napus]
MKTFSSFFLFVTTLFFSVFSLSLQASSPSQSLYREIHHLISFKNVLPDKNLLPDWSPDKNPCTFHGVTCKEDKVTSIDLSSKPLNVGFTAVASSLLSLAGLESLFLSNSHINGSISDFKCTASLTSLDLSMNSISGPVSTLSSFGSCIGLQHLNVSSNTLDFPGKVSGGLKLSSLEVLDLSSNSLSGANVVGWILSNGCTELKHLSVSGNKISGDVDVSRCVNLEFLDISSNNFSTSIPSLGDCSSLQHLDISGNKFSGDFSNAISSCTELKSLNISGNQFAGTIPPLPLKSLQYLSLAENNFTGEIPELLSGACGTLTGLDLSGNEFRGTVPPFLASCHLLELLVLSSNNFSGELPMDTLLKMRGLKVLDLTFNEFSGELPESLTNLSASLLTLDLSSNNFSGLILPNLCRSPKTTLQELYLQNNGFTGKIPATLSNCSELVSLHLSFNYLSGTIPSSLGSLSKLRDLKLWLNMLEGEIPQELMYVNTLETLILDFNYLTGEIPSGLSNCTNLNWISLSNNRLTGQIPRWIGRLESLAILKLSNNSFYGNIPAELGDCRSLIWLDLNTNYFNGTIPAEMFKQSGKIAVNFIAGKRYVYIKNDGMKKECHGAGNLLEFQGIRWEQLNRVSTRNPCNFTRVYKGHTSPTFDNNGSMMFLDMSYNMLSGYIPKEIGSTPYLFILNLGHNFISGSIPDEVGDLRGLNILDLSSNKLDGRIPQAMSALTMLTEIDLSNNLLSGPIPEMGQFETFPPVKFLNNSGLCGYPLPRCGPANADGSAHQRSHGRKHASVAGSVAMGLLFSFVCIFGLILVGREMRKRRRKKEAELEMYGEGHGNSGDRTANNTNWKLTGAKEALSISLAAFEKPLRKLTFADLLQATNGFHNDTMIGSGGFGDVYKAVLKDGSAVAIKKLIHVSGQGDREFMAEMETIGKIKHRNLVPLLGYCKVGEERLLVYEFMKYGSLEDVLHDPKKAGVKLTWSMRRKIAIGAARGLAFLHHTCIPHIIHRDMKSSNVLLDENLEARVSDFGMARLMSAMDTHLSVSTLAGTPGYVPPEYYQSFRCSRKGDVYSYGVVLLELLTGKRPTDSPDFGDNNLVGWVKQHAKLRIRDVFDPELLKEDPALEIELLQHLKVAVACLEDRAWKRPTILQVMAKLKEIQAGSGIDSQSTIGSIEDGGFSSVEMVDMSIKEVPEGKL